MTIEPDGIFLLSGGIVNKGGKIPHFVPTGYNDLDEYGYVTGGIIRVHAAAELAKKFPRVKLVTSSRFTHLIKGVPTHAQVYARALLASGVPRFRIIMRKTSVNTLTELHEAVKLSWLLNWHTIGILSNNYHLPRIKEMYREIYRLGKKDRHFIKAWQGLGKGKKLNVIFMGAEKILMQKNDFYRKKLAAWQKTPGYKMRLLAEKKGLQDLRAGKYETR